MSDLFALLPILALLLLAAVMFVAGLFWGHSSKPALAKSTETSSAGLFLLLIYGVCMAAEIFLIFQGAITGAIILAVPSIFVTGIVWGRTEMSIIPGRWF